MTDDFKAGKFAGMLPRAAAHIQGAEGH